MATAKHSGTFGQQNRGRMSDKDTQVPWEVMAGRGREVGKAEEPGERCGMRQCEAHVFSKMAGK